MNKINKKSILLRYYNAKNLGDDIFVKIISERYSDYFFINRNSKNNVFKYYKNIKSVPFIGAYRWKILNKFKPNDYPFITPQFCKSDYLVYVGGSIFIENHDLDKWIYEKKLYNKLKIPYYIIGANVGPWHTIEFLDIVNNIFTKASDVCLRDNASFAHFKQLPTVRKSSDLLFNLDIKKYIISQERIVVISVINCRGRFSDAVSNAYEDKLYRISRRLISMGYSVNYMSFCKFEGDEVAIGRILLKHSTEELKNITTYFYNGKIDEAISHISKCEFIVGTRFHATVIGLLFNKKVLPVVYSAKTANFLVDLGFNGTIIEIQNVDLFDETKFDFESINIHDVKEQIFLAQSHFQELDKVLTRTKYE